MNNNSQETVKTGTDKSPDHQEPKPDKQKKTTGSNAQTNARSSSNEATNATQNDARQNGQTNNAAAAKDRTRDLSTAKTAQSTP